MVQITRFTTQQSSSTSPAVKPKTPLQVCRAIQHEITWFIDHTDLSTLTESELSSAHTRALQHRKDFCTTLTNASNFIELHLEYHRALHDAGASVGPEPHQTWPTKILPSYQSTLASLDTLSRSLRYAIVNKPLFSLPDTGPYTSNQAYFSRNNTIARLSWLHHRNFASDPVFPNRWRNRYAMDDWYRDPDVLREVLPLDYHWLVASDDDLQIPINAEWTSIFRIVGEVTRMGQGLLERFLEVLVKKGVMRKDAMLHAASFTQRATWQAIKAGVERCVICGGRHYVLWGSGEPREDAVKLVCGHFIGEKCLQDWLDTKFVAEDEEDDVNCPLCRTCLIIGSYPQHLQGTIKELVEHMRSDEALDREVDEFLLGAKEEDGRGCYGPELGVMLENMDLRRKKIKGMIDTLPDELVEEVEHEEDDE